MKNTVVAEVAVVEEKAVVKKVAPKKKVATKKAEVAKVEPKKNEQKKSVSVPQLTNDELKALFIDNGCQTYTNASNGSKVVYNTFGTKSRVLQQGKAYQLLLTNGHKMVKNNVVDSENDDAGRFISWYETLSEDEKKMVSGYSEMMATKLAMSEMPREKTVKITSYDLLVKFIQHMSTFAENQKLTPATTKQCFPSLDGHFGGRHFFV